MVVRRSTASHASFTSHELTEFLRALSFATGCHNSNANRSVLSRSSPAPTPREPRYGLHSCISWERRGSTIASVKEVKSAIESGLVSSSSPITYEQGKQPPYLQVITREPICRRKTSAGDAKMP